MQQFKDFQGLVVLFLEMLEKYRSYLHLCTIAIVMANFLLSNISFESVLLSR